MRQFLAIKDGYPDAILFFRMGDFYEMFFEDAVTAAKALDLTLTSRDKGKEDAIPMCGVPHHAGRGYVARLTELGHKVVICEQVEDPKLAKGLVKREVTRVITPGVVLDEDILDAKVARYVAAVTSDEAGRCGLAYLDVSTGEFLATELASREALIDELARVGAREILGDRAQLDEPGTVFAELRAALSHVSFSAIEPAAEDARARLLAEVLADADELSALAEQAAADVVAYARGTQPGGTLPIARLLVYRPDQTLVLDESSTANLELVESLMERKKHGSLLGVLDSTKTAPGGRLLRRWLLFPLVDVAQIRRRQDAVQFLFERASVRDKLRQRLAEVCDLERLVGRIKLGVAAPKDMIALRQTLEQLPCLATTLASELKKDLAAPELLAFEKRELAACANVASDIAMTLADEVPAQAKDGGFVRDGYSREIDDLRQLASGGKDNIMHIESRERERTKIGTLKVRYNRVFGYYIEITHAALKNTELPAGYVRKQTLANAERYVTEELADLEAQVLGAEDKLKTLEARVFEALCQSVGKQGAVLSGAAQRLARLDVFCSLADVAHRQDYVRPLVNDAGELAIIDGRHPVVEKLAAAGVFVPNDCALSPNDQQVVIITGPNMAGKSTYMRQVAIITLMAQMGSFVPAKSATLGVVDRIFTRVGASDNLARGESTFMVEMREAAHILQHATRRSLIILDEIGRGTSTYDGLSIAWAVAEYIHDAIGAKTLFATHYHELAEMAEDRARMHNVSVAVREHRDRVIFLRKVVPGGASRSYGIEVARLAGLPKSVVARARQVLAELERPPAQQSAQLSLLPTGSPHPAAPAMQSQIVDKLDAIDLNETTPMQALHILSELKQLGQ